MGTHFGTVREVGRLDRRASFVAGSELEGLALCLRWTEGEGTENPLSLQPEPADEMRLSMHQSAWQA